MGDQGERQIPRQAFVRGALGMLTAGALLGACRSDPMPQPAKRTVTAMPRPEDWTTLGQLIEGRVILPPDAGFSGAKDVFNTRFDNSTPAAVVAVKSTSDVQKVMDFAAKSGMKVAARSGGHSYIGASAANGAIVVDLRQLPGETTYDAARGLATVPAAVGLDSVQTALSAHGRSIPTGSCPTVGVAGLTLGGGLGSETRRLGLTCDALVSASVVLPGGEVVTASADDHSDLFWGLRGGGGGNFGVATSFTFMTTPTGDRDVVNMAFPLAATAQVITGWQQWMRAADRAIWGLVNVNAGVGCTVVLATPPGDGPDRARDIAGAIGVAPVDNSSRTLGHLEFVHYFEGGAQAARPRAFVAGSDIVGELTQAAAESIVAATSRWPGGAGSDGAGSASAIVESLSGAVGDVGPGDSAFPWRRHAACIQWYTEPSESNTTPSAVDAANTWLAEAHRAMGEHSVGGYVNYVELGVSASRYFGDNLARFGEIRRRYDPDEVMQSGISF